MTERTSTGATIADRGSSSESDRQVERIGQRIDALPASRKLWTWVIAIAVGGFFEIYDLALTAPLSAGLVKAGIFRTGHAGLFGVADQATLISATFLGLYLGVISFAAFGDRVGRRVVFTYALLLYAAATLVIGFQTSAVSICFWRFVAGIGVGAEAVAIDCFVAELVPSRLRGRAFSVTMAIQYCAVPVCALLGAVLIPHAPLGVSGWRWLTAVPAIGAILLWAIRRKLPESPRWLASRGRLKEANAVLDRLPGTILSHSQATKTTAFRQALAVTRGYLARVTVMLVVYFMLQTIAFYGFANWVPTLLTARGVPLGHSLLYNAGIALAYPVAPLLLIGLSDRFERKYIIMAGGVASIVFGLLFGSARAPAQWLLFGIGLTLANSVVSSSSHNYLSEVYPTHLRARLSGFVYSFTRLAAAGSGYIIAGLLAFGGPTTVFTGISIFMAAALLIVLLLGPKTRNVSPG